jgi:thiosulfate dehydrogenase
MLADLPKGSLLMHRPPHPWLIACAFLTLAASSVAQEQSVKPGINDSFRNPDPKEFVGRFETESREVFLHRDQIVAACGIQPGQTVADIGAGTGLFTRLFSDAVGKDGRVIAVDIAQNFLDHIEKSSREAGRRNVETLLCKADSTELLPGSVDVAFICDTYHHFEFPLKTMASLHRALKPGGRVVLIDFRRVPDESTEWVLTHVRAGQEVFEAEIAQSGFRKVSERRDLLKENYFVVFEKALEPLLPQGPLGETIRLGRELVERTASHPLSKPYVGNALNCTSCHLQNGTDPQAATFLGVATAYPAWSPRERRVITLEDRILNCFMRSCHGLRPPLGSEVSVSIAAYITWLSTDEPIRMNGNRPAGPRAVPGLNLDGVRADPQRGGTLYAARCASCHGENGLGDDDNPPVWGPRSFNEGAGLARVPQLAAWLKVAMPLDETDLTDQEALDIAAFVNSHSRPKFRLEEHLPPADQRGVYNAADVRP